MNRKEHLQETRRQGTLQFPCTMYFAYDAPDDPDLPDDRGRLPFEVKPHWHDALEILHLERGIFRVGVNMERYVIEDEAFLFVERGTIHTIWSEKDYTEQAILFESALLDGEDAATREIVQPLMQGKRHFPIRIEAEDAGFLDIKELYQTISDLFLSYGEDYEDQRHLPAGSAQLRVKAALLNMMAVLAEHELITGEKAAPDPRVEALKDVITYMRMHYAEKIYISDLAKIMNMNEQYFCRFFHKTTGRTPVTYMNELRIRQAAQLLASKDMPILEIAGECGYTNIGHFIEVFKRMTGYTPSGFRSRNR